MPEPQEQKKPWEKFAAPIQTAGPWDRYQGAGAKKPSVPAPAASKEPTGEEDTIAKASRGAVLGAAHGLGIPETKDPIGDLWNGITAQGIKAIQRPDLAPGEQAIGIGKNVIEALKEIHESGSRMKGDPELSTYFHGGKAPEGKPKADTRVDAEHFTHGLSSLITQLLMLKGVKEAIGEHASVVDGGIKVADKITKGAGKESGEAVTTAHKLSSGAPSRLLRRRAFEDAYVHAKGLDVAKKIDKAVKSVNEEVKTHAQGIASQIDTKIPTGVVDATAEAATIMKEFQDVVKTPEKAHPVLVQMVKDAQATSPKLWSWEKARQFRSSVGRAMSGDKVVGPQKVVLTKVYIDLTKKLSGAAKQYGLEKSWNQYNELASKMDKEFSDITDGITDAKSGQEVAQKLNKDVALTSEMSKNLSKYGLKHKEVLQYATTAKRIANAKNFMNRSLFRLVYGSPPGLATAMSLRMAGAPYIAALGGGALVGLSTSYLVSLARIMKLSPEIIEHMMRERELPGKMKFEEGTFPSEGEPSTPTAPPPKPKTLPESAESREKAMEEISKPPPGYEGTYEDGSPKASVSSGVGDVVIWKINNPPFTFERAKAVLEDPEAGSLGRKLSSAEVEVLKKIKTWDEFHEAETQWFNAERAKLPIEERMKKLGITPDVPPIKKVEAGTHGTGKLAEQAKARERVSKARAGAKRTKEAIETEAKARAQATHMDVSQLQIPEMEEYLRTKNPTALKGLIKMRKLGTPDAEYIEALKYLILEDLEK